MEPEQTKRQLIRNGVFLFLLGLLSGAVVPALTNPRMGLSAHLGGVMSGAFLIVVGLAWGEIKLSAPRKKILIWLFLYASYAGWLAQLLAAAFGTSRSMPMAGAGFRGTPWQENVVDFMAISFSLTITMASLLALWGLRDAHIKEQG